MIIDYNIKIEDFKEDLKAFWKLSGEKILSIDKSFDLSLGAPVFTANGKYTSRGWTEWTQGFMYGSAILQYDATEDDQFLNIGRKGTLEKMMSHISHVGVHDHGFNNLSTYGNLLRLMNEGKIEPNDWVANYYKQAIMVSGAVQAARWQEIADGGYIYSFSQTFKIPPFRRFFHTL
mgnify:FL=1